MVASAPLVHLGPLSLRRRHVLALTFYCLVMVVVLFVSAPPLAPGVLVACLIPPVVWSLADALPLRLDSAAARDRVWSWLALFIFAAWMLLSTTWSPDRRTGTSSAVWSLAVIGIVFAVTSLAPRVAEDARRTMARALVAAVAVSVLLVLWEALTDMSLRRVAMSILPPLRPRNPDAVIENGWVKFLPLYMIKKNAAVVMMLFWPALLIGVRNAETPLLKRVLSLFIALFVVAILIAGHDSSRFALGISSGFWLLSLWRPALARGGAVVLWLIATLAVIPITHSAYLADLHKSSFIQYSGRHRIVIWERTAESFFKAPIRGAGIAATRYVDETTPAGAQRVLVPGTDIPEGVNIHAHNAFLQTWHELGAIGALLLAAAGWPLLAWIRRRRERDQPYLYATFATVATIASLSWSLTAAWLLATYGIVAIMAQLAVLSSEDVDATGDEAEPELAPGVS